MKESSQQPMLITTKDDGKTAKKSDIMTRANPYQFVIKTIEKETKRNVLKCWWSIRFRW